MTRQRRHQCQLSKHLFGRRRREDEPPFSRAALNRCSQMSSAGKQPDERKRRGSKHTPAPLQQDVKGKVLLPRPVQGWPQPTNSPKRTSHACDRCRVMKIKCSGGDRCKKCTADDQECVYGDGKRERHKKLGSSISPQKGS